MQRALALGADAVVSVRHEGHSQGKAQLKIGKVILLGTAVKLAE
jgi:uncharacterized protein YbjQ (UPF0145 family)